MPKKVQSRKTIEGALGKARAAFLKAKGDLDKATKELNAAKSRVDDATARLTEAKKTINSCTDNLRIMDLTGAKAVKHDKDDVSYVIDGKPHRVFMDSNDVRLEPVMRHKRDSGAVDDNSAANSLSELIDEMSDDNKVKDKLDELDTLDGQAGNGDQEAALERRIIEAELKDSAMGLKKGEFVDWTDNEIRYLVAVRNIRGLR